MLNSNPMGGKRRSAHHDDLWCLKYLPKFKWDHLTEEMGTSTVAAGLIGISALCTVVQHAADMYLGASRRQCGCFVTMQWTPCKPVCAGTRPHLKSDSHKAHALGSFKHMLGCLICI